MTDRQWGELHAAFNALIRQLQISNRLAQATAKQWYTVPELQDRYALGREALVGVLVELGIYKKGKVGARPRVHRESVLKIDELLLHRVRREAPKPEAQKPGLPKEANGKVSI